MEKNPVLIKFKKPANVTKGAYGSSHKMQSPEQIIKSIGHALAIVRVNRVGLNCPVACIGDLSGTHMICTLLMDCSGAIRTPAFIQHQYVYVLVL